MDAYHSGLLVIIATIYYGGNGAQALYSDLTMSAVEIPSEDNKKNDNLKWKVQYNDSDELLIYLELNGSIVQTTALFLHSIGLKALILTHSLRLEKEIQFDVDCNCWKLSDTALVHKLSTLPEFTVTSAVIHQYKNYKFLPTKWFIMKQETDSRPQTTNEFNLARNLEGKYFYHPCRPSVVVFITNSKLFFTQDNFHFSSKLKLQFNGQENVQIADIIVDLDGVVFVGDRRIYVARFHQKTLQLQRVSTDIEVIGITSTPICYKNSYVRLPHENRDALVWTNVALYNLFLTDVWSGAVNVLQLQSAEVFEGPDIADVKYGTIPNNVIIAKKRSGNRSLKIHSCKLRRHMMSNCKTVGEFGGLQSNEAIALHVGNCIHFCGFISTQDSIYYIKEKRDKIEVTENPSLISFNGDRTLGLFATPTKWTFFATDGAYKHIELNLTQYNGFVPQLHTSEEMLLLKCNDKCDTVAARTIDLRELVKMSNDVKTYFNFTADQNVFSVSDLQHDVELNGHTSYPYNHPVFLDLDYNLGSSDIKIATKSKLSTDLISDNIVTSAEFTIKVGLKCKKKKILSCRKGMTKFSLQFKPKGASEDYFYPSRVFFVNVTCPDNIKLILGPKTTGGGCISDVNCTVRIKESNLVHLSFELHRGNKKLEEVKDDIVLTELNGRSGFYINNHFVLGRECFLCDQFYNLSTSSQLALQTQESACPCKPGLFDHDTWTGNISFLGAATYTNNEDNFYFRAQVVDDSLCDHQTYFRIKIFIIQPPLFQFWEFLIILIFFFVTFVALVISYKNYFTFMKENKDKMSFTALKK